LGEVRIELAKDLDFATTYQNRRLRRLASHYDSHIGLRIQPGRGGRRHISSYACLVLGRLAENKSDLRCTFAEK